jgi:hypothetical protein
MKLSRNLITNVLVAVAYLLNCFGASTGGHSFKKDTIRFANGSHLVNVGELTRFEIESYFFLMGNSNVVYCIFVIEPISPPTRVSQTEAVYAATI